MSDMEATILRTSTELLRALVLGLSVNKADNGWEVGPTRSRVGSAIIDHLLREGFIAVAGERVEITDAGSEVVRSSEDRSHAKAIAYFPGIR